MRDDRTALLLSLIDRLQAVHGASPLERRALIEWLEAQLEQLQRLQLGSDSLHQRIEAAYTTHLASLRNGHSTP